jgi:probable HAF family extracellular repeat protein
VARAINDHGQIVGWSGAQKGERRLFLWARATGMQDLGPEAEGLVDINNHGWIVGDMLDANGNEQAFIRDPNGSWTLLGTLGGPESSARKLNDNNQVVGVSDTAMGVGHAFYWDRTSGMVDLGTLGGASSWARKISNAGLVFGYSDTATGETRSFVWDANEGMVTGPIGHLYDLNNGSHVVGEHHYQGDGDYAVTWRKDTGIVKLFRLESAFVDIVLINDANQVIWEERFESRWGKLKQRLHLSSRFEGGRRWFLWDRRQGRIRLDPSVRGRAREFWPLALNNNGSIVGVVMSKDETEAKAVLLEPIPEMWEP